MIHVAVTNRSSVLIADDVDAITRALNVQVTHLQRAGYPVWAQAQVYTHTPPANAWELLILDNSDQPDALAYHDVTAQGEPVMKCFAGTAVDAGLSPTVGISHEWCETLVDPWCQLAVPLQSGQWLAWEVSDAVEADHDGYTINGVAMSDFVYPSWFSGMGGPPWDWTGVCNGPLELRPGGYALIESGGVWQQVVARTDQPTRADMAHRIDIRRRIKRRVRSSTPMQVR